MSQAPNYTPPPVIAQPDASLNNPPYGIDPNIFGSPSSTPFDYMTPQDFNAILQGYGIPAGVFTDLINEAVVSNWSAEELVARIYATPQFHSMFPGIFRTDGSMRFTPTEYRSITDNYQSMARQFGVTGLDKGQLGALIDNNVSVQEFTDRMTAVQRLSEFKPSLEAFRDLLKASGQDTSAIDTDEGLTKFLLGEAPKQFYQLYEQTNTLTQARQTGFVGKNQGVGMARRIAKLTPGIMSEQDLQVHFSNLAKEARTAIPVSQWARMGVTKKDLVQLEFGGPRMAAVAERVADVMGQQQAAQNQVYVSGVQPSQRRGQKAQSQ